MDAKRNIDEALNEGVAESICDLCGTVLTTELYCPSCNPDGITIFEGVTTKAYNKLKEQNALLQSEVERLREPVTEFFKKWPGVEILVSERKKRDREAYATLRAIARRAMEGRDEHSI